MMLSAYTKTTIFLLLILFSTAYGSWLSQQLDKLFGKTKKKECPSIGSASHRSVSCSKGRNVKSTCTFSCSRGYYVSGSSSVTCNSNRRWSGSFPTCRRDYCSSIDDASYRSHSCTDWRYVDSRCTFSCSSGFELRGYSSVTCDSDAYWSRSFPSCQRKQCSSIGSASHRSYSCSNGRYYESRCSFSCSRGYDLIGYSSVTCKSNRYWSGSFPSCRIKTCSPLPTPRYGSISCSSLTYGVSCYFQCNSGYSRSGSSSRTCQGGNSWSGSTTSCRDTQSPTLTCPVDLQATNDDRSTSAVVTYPTPIAYDNSGSSPSINKEIGQDSGTSFSSGMHEVRYRATDGSGNDAYCSFFITVSIISCPNIPLQDYSIIECPDSTLRGATCTFTCFEGYAISGPSEISCLSNGAWNTDIPNCVEISCPRLSAPDNGNITSCNTSHRSLCTFSCLEGYDLIGSDFRTCEHIAGESEGYWTGDQPRCAIRTCQLPPLVGGLRLLNSSSCPLNLDNTVNYGSVCEYSCTTGHRLTGSHLRNCQISGSWLEVLPVCTVITCDFDDLPELKNGVWTGCAESSIVYGDSCTVTCNRGYLRNNQTQKTCEDHGGEQGAWSSGNSTCSVITCSQLSASSNGTISACKRSGSPTTVKGEQLFDTSCTIDCDDGYTLTSGSNFRTCLVSGQWSGQDPVCTDVTPPSLQCPPHAVVYAESGQTTGSLTWDWEPLMALDATGQYTADLFLVDGQQMTDRPSYFNEGSHTLTYSVSDNSGNNASCNMDVHVLVNQCPPPEIPHHGNVTGEGCSKRSPAIWGTVCHFVCNSGYEMVSENHDRTCLQNTNNPLQGVWSGTLPQCTAVQCVLPDFPHSFISGCRGKSVSYQESCQFVCDAGYRTADGESVRTHTCQADRSWGDQDFNCSVQITCPKLQVPLNGTVHPPNCTSTTMPFGSVCEFTCVGGYGLTGSGRVQCLSSGSWSDPSIPTCSDITEPVFEVPCPKTVKEVAGSGETSWTGQIEPPTATDNAGHVTVRRRDGSNSSVTVYPEGITPLVFEAVDESGNTAICIINLRVEVRRCKPLIPPQGGSTENCNTHYGSTCNISCNLGYDFSNGSSERTCEVDDNGILIWSGFDTVCTIRRCPLLVPPDNALPYNCGGIPGNLATYGSVCSFFCTRGFNSRGLDRVECQANATWSEISFICEAITCQNLSLPGGSVFPPECFGTPEYGRQCAFSCPVGYSVFPVISARVTCLRIGNWSSDIRNVQCKDTTLPVFDSCPPPGDRTFYTSPDNGTAFVTWPVTATDNSNDTVVITCQPERESSLVLGNYQVTCTARDSAGNMRHCLFNIEVKDRTCPLLSPPFFGSFKGACSNKEGSNCTIICDVNYRLVGSSELKCETVDGITTWIPVVFPRCEAVTCNPLESFDNHGSITPFYCQDPSIPRAGEVCNITCTDRYSLEANPSNVSSSIQCGQDGSWGFDVEETFACSDNVPPEIQYCPAPVRVRRTNIFRPVRVYVDLPQAVDNSNEEMQPILSPSGTPPYSVSQDTTINCLFRDSAGNQNDQCQINVAVIDVVQPVIIRPCPDDIEVTASASQMRVSWVEPRFSDPGGKHVFVTSNFAPGSMFRVGSYTVQYVGTNERTGQTTGCQFQIEVTLESCPTLAAAPHGVLACHETSEGQVCVLSCKPGYRSLPQQPTTFFCDAQGNWQPSRVADCGVTHRPTSSRMPVRASYSTSNCRQAGQTKQIATAFLDQLLKTRFQDICSESNGCTVENIRVTCGPINTRSRGRGRGKRSAILENSDNLGWSFDFDVVVDVDNRENVSDSQSVRIANTTLQSLGSTVGDILPPSIELPETDGGNTSLAQNSVEIENVAVTCDAGLTFDDLQSECVACVAGTFFREDEQDCHPCPVGSYQDEERQTMCKMCPVGTSTDGKGVSRLDECYDLCPSGTYSQDGLFSCKRCEIGFYQPAKGQTACISCPDGQKTKTVGATNVSECSEPCPPGSSSSTGLGPCTPCPQRYYQPTAGQRFCLICEGRKTTEGTGSTNQSQCIELDHCSNQPCQNGGRCLSLLEGYICRCLPGFKGQNCEVNFDECQSGPCRNGGTCVDGSNSFQCFCKEGLTGQDCSIDINECDQQPCANGGTCVDAYGSFFCYCPPRFEGSLCETEKNYCNSSPCQNEGECRNLRDGYDCHCSPGFTGKNCEQRKSPCFDKPCINGDCVDIGEGDYQCSCFSGFMGKDCDILIDFCAELSCENGGSCIKTADGAICVCPPKFAGDTCDHLRTICDDEICLNGATCNPGDENWAEYFCKCAPGFTGTNCETNINECASMPCSTGATCHDQVDGYRCECPSEYEGYYDEICELLDTCMVTPCINGGTCHHYEDSSSECECPPGYRGDRCEVDINECSSSPCMNFGFCVDKVNHYECVCLSAYTGTKCEIKLPGNADMIFLSSDEHDVFIDVAAPFENLEVPFIKLGYWFRAMGDPDDFTLFEYIPGDSSLPDLKVQNISHLAVELFGDLCFALDNRDLSDSRWHNLLLTINTGESFEMAVDGELVENKNLSLADNFELGGRVRIGFERTSKVAQVLVSGVHIWSYSGMEVFSACHPTDSGDILAWEQMLALSEGTIETFSPSFCDDVDNCHSHPCMGNATCVDHLDSFLCICPDRFTGDRCDQMIDFCHGHKCQNEASCVSTSHNFTCVCPKEFTGHLCHIPVEQEDGSDPQTP